MKDRIASLRQALESLPEDHNLRLMLAELLVATGSRAEALVEYERLLDREALPPAQLVPVGTLAAEQGAPALALRCLRQAESVGTVEGIAELAGAVEKLSRERGVLRLVEGGGGSHSDTTGEGRDSEVRPLPLPVKESLTFAAVGGLAEVKKVIHRMIILPFKRPELYQQYGKRAGGGVLLYGPPGCGKTMLARATAGECGLPFLNLRIEDVLGPFMGESERNLHGAFEQARAAAPCVLFIDELDALAYARSKQAGSASRALVDQILQELDAIGSANENLLVLAATNAPWDVDDALKRPGRFDRVVFVPPPDAGARAAILDGLLAGRPTQAVATDALATATPLYSGADLRALVERAVDEVIDQALGEGGTPPLERRHFDAALADMRPSTLDWLGRARNYVEFANRNERYKDVEAFLKSAEVKRYKV